MSTKINNLLITVCLICYTQVLIHTVPEGSVGINYRNGRLGNETYPPGIYCYIPIIDNMSNTNIRIKVNDIQGIICTSVEGSIMVFRILVNNQLKEQYVIDNVRNYSEIYEEFLLKQPIIQKMTEWCSEKTFKEILNTNWENLDTLITEHLKEYQQEKNTNLKINLVTVFKPQIDKQIQQNFDIATREITKRDTELEKRKRVLEEETTNRLLDEAVEEKKNSIAKIHNDKLISQKQTDAEMIRIEADGYYNTINTRADADAYYNGKIAESEIIRFTPEFLQKHWQEHVLANATLIYGEKIPTYMGTIPIKIY
jgi:regulator of protease activity HflC (stomatin/prohibitin superfamily)